MAAVQIPPGINLQDDQGPELIRATMAIAVLSGLAVAGRLVSRRMLRVNFSVSDGLLLIALIGSWAIAGLDVWEANLGIGKHIYVVPPENYATILKVIFALEILYSIALTSTKISILTLYHGLFPGKTFTQLLYGLGAFCIAWGISVFFVAIFSCTPIHGFWDIMMQPPPKCINNKAFYIGLSVPNILADIAILSLPVTKVWHLQMSRRSKIAVSGMFLLGGFVVISSIVRFVFLLVVDNTDFTWTFYGIVLWSCIECNVAVISACIPTLRPILQKVLPSAAFAMLLGTTNKQKNYKSDPAAWKNASSGTHGEEFQRLHDHPFDGSRNTKSPIPLSGNAPVPSAKETEPGLKPLPQIHVKNDVWVQKA